MANLSHSSSGYTTLIEEKITPYSINVYNPSVLSLSTNDPDKVRDFQLYQNYPNPFNPTTTISFYLPKAENVKLEVFDITGRLVSTLEKRKMNAGSHTRQFDASEFSSGVYFYRIETGTFTSIQKMTLIK